MSWTDYNYPDIRLSSFYNFANGLINALNERRSVVGLSTLENYERLEIILPQFRREFMIYFNISLNETLIEYVNQTVNNGDFTGLDEIPMWTVEDIYDYLGEDEILPQQFKIEPIMSARWAQQKYRVINLLIWINNENSTLTTTAVPNSKRVVTNNETQTRNDFQNNPVQQIDGVDPIFRIYESFDNFFIMDGIFSIVSFRLDFTDFNREFTAYLKAVKPDFTNIFYSISPFIDENIFYNIPINNITPNFIVNLDPYFVDNFSEYENLAFDIPLNSGCQIKTKVSDINAKQSLIEKFNVPNGFQFVA